MAAVMFDTHEYIKELKGAGFSEEQAEIITKLQKASANSTLETAKHEYDLDHLVTNQSLDARIKETELKLDARAREMELKFDARIKETELKIAETKTDMIRWVVSVGLLQTALITALLLKLIASLPG